MSKFVNLHPGGAAVLKDAEVGELTPRFSYALSGSIPQQLSWTGQYVRYELVKAFSRLGKSQTTLVENGIIKGSKVDLDRLMICVDF